MCVCVCVCVHKFHTLYTNLPNIFDCRSVRQKVTSECGVLDQIISLLIRSNKYMHWLECLSCYLINNDKCTKTNKCKNYVISIEKKQLEIRQMMAMAELESDIFYIQRDQNREYDYFWDVDKMQMEPLD